MRVWKRTALLGAVLGLLMTACEQKKDISGQITQVWTEGDGTLSALTIRTEQGRELGFQISPETRIFDDLADYQPGNVVMMTYTGRAGTLTGAAGEEVKAYEASYASILEWLERGAVTLEDGTVLDVSRTDWEDEASYRLPDGEVLLRTHCFHVPNTTGAYIGEGGKVYGLSEKAQEQVRAYYEAQGKLYDVDLELERAWKEYQELGENFSTHWVSQQVVSEAYNEKLMYFSTTVYLPLVGNRCRELRLGAAFDRETGEAISPWELFSCPREEAIRVFLDQAGVEDEGARDQMEAALQPENILFLQDTVQFYFPQGTLPGEGEDRLLSVHYDQLEGLLWDWAIPM